VAALKAGLTGGIGSGKSEVSRRLAEHGAIVIDADRIAREVVEPGSPGLERVVAEFGPEVLREDGSLDRERLGAIVFADRDRLAALNAIVHPLVGARVAELQDAAPDDAIVVYDVPLLVESGFADAFHLVVLVQAPAVLRVERLVRTRGMDRAEAERRIAAQAPDEERLAVADVVLDGSGAPEDLQAQVDALWDRLAAERRDEREVDAP